MSHTTAINVLHDELDDIQKTLEQMNRSLTGLLARKHIFHVSISDAAILRLQRNIREYEESRDSIQNTINVLEEKSIEYGFRPPETKKVYSFEGISFKKARDICEIIGAQLMRRTNNGWAEA